jgi:cyclic pyranopterin phosphate synthase
MKDSRHTTRRSLVKIVVDDGEYIDSSDNGSEHRVSSARRAVARSRITMQEQTVSSVAANSLRKGDALGTARFAGVQAAKNAASLLPIQTSVLVRSATIEFALGDDTIDVEAVVECFDAVGAEMPALSAATAAALTIYDMCKSADRTMTIGPVELVERSGDSSTNWRRNDSSGD